jgi:hypothetical protein
MTTNLFIAMSIVSGIASFLLSTFVPSCIPLLLLGAFFIVFARGVSRTFPNGEPTCLVAGVLFGVGAYVLQTDTDLKPVMLFGSQVLTGLFMIVLSLLVVGLYSYYRESSDERNSQ